MDESRRHDAGDETTREDETVMDADQGNSTSPRYTERVNDT
jgi:hypothetical protein